MLRGIRTHALHVPELQAAKAWYTELLGFPPYFDEPFYVGFDVGGYELALHPPDDVTPLGRGGSTTYWQVDDVTAALTRATRIGATVVQDAMEVGGGIVVGSVEDPFGNVLGFIFNPHFAPPLTDVSLAEMAEAQIVKEAHFAAPAQQLWSLWCDPGGWLVDEADVELRVGGRYALHFDPSQKIGFRGSEGCRILSLLPNKMLSFTWNAPPSIPETRARRTWVVVELEPRGDGTLVRLTHLGWPAGVLANADTPWAKTFAYFDRAWGLVLAALARHLDGTTTA